jgi:thiol-disulfide isomerase/thioredoxin
MRCNNCGFDNTLDRVRCIKCNAPLKGSMIAHDEIKTENSQTDLSGTIKGKQVSAKPWDCPKCGRPVVVGANECNNCDYVFDGVIESEESENKNYKDKKQNKIKGTIDPYEQGFILKPVATKYEDELPEIKIKMNDEKMKLGREKLEPENNTISANQAEFEFKNGKWYIKNTSKKQSTFVLANDFIELNDGDIIMMGNRKFVFKR